MPTHDGDLPREEVRERMEDDEPLVGTPVLDLSLRANLPFRSTRREEIVAVVRENIRERRKAEILSDRVEQNAAEPVRGAIQAEAQDVIRSRIKSIMGRGGQ